MKRFILLLSGLFISLSLSAQLDRSVRPEPAPAKPLDFGKYKVYELDNGLKVIAVRNTKLPRVTISLIVDRDPIIEGDKSGYVSLTGDLLRSGTTNRSKEQLDEEVDFIGARLSAGATSVYASGLSKYSETLMELVADVALNPSFPEEEFDKLKKQSLSGIESAKESPDQLSSRLFNATLYGLDHPYGEQISERSLEQVALEDCKKFYQQYWGSNDAYIAIVGDIKPRKAKKLVKKYFGDWKPVELPETEYPTVVAPTAPQVNVLNRNSSVQSVLKIGNSIDLKPGDEDVVKVRLMNQILGGGSLGRLFKNIREDKGFTYGAYSNYDSDRLIGSFSAGASVRNEVTDSAISEFLYEFERLQKEAVSAEDLQAAKNYIGGSFGRSLESPQSIASFALNIQRYNLPEDYYENYLPRLNAVSAEEIMATAQKYINKEALNISVVGRAADIVGGLEQFGEIRYFDFYGEETEAPMMPVPDGVTAESVLAAYAEALGGAEKLAEVKDISMQMNTEITGMPMKATSVMKRMRPNLFLQEISVEGMGTLQKVVYDGKKGKTSGMQGSKELSDEELEEVKEQGAFFAETQYTDKDYELKLQGIVMLDGEQAYMLEVNKGDQVSTEYYSVESGLKLREESTVGEGEEALTVSTSYSDYRAVKGIYFPYRTELLQGAQKISFTAEKIEVNSGLKKKDFE